MTVGIEDIRAAAEAIEGEVVRTPLIAAPRLSQTLGCEISLKLEHLQFTGSFKDRGALNKLKSLSPAEAERGVIAMSAGNHAQGVAHHAQRLGIPATIVMPEFAPFTKVERTRSFGARVVLEGDTIDAAAEAARRIQQEEGLAFIHPYDDPMIVAGQGTIGLEMLADRPDLELIVVPIGGGGIISGIALAAKALNPEIRILGVEAELYPSMYQALNALAPSAGGTTLADGIAVKTPGGLTKAIVADLVDEILLVDEPGIEAAVQLLVEEQKLVAEGAGAAGIAAILKYPERFAGRRVATVICGGNIDVRLLASVLTRGLIRDGRLVKLRVEIVDRPGMLGKISECIGQTGGNIIEVHHQRMFSDVPAKQADLDIMVETRNPAHVDEIVSLLKAQGFPTRIVSSRSIDPGS
ncbi:MAG: threonine ammonia-lyase [Kiloniellales bacterium]|nr:threonine ammonia-lyase [Kiloniellales bacterium]MDJ0972311.1 threonine ammonia-lyase [Kiloniellales bacterium]MDJ0983657.1 threonine ammonia-lyase [Kiloniellales bacterium]